MQRFGFAILTVAFAVTPVFAADLPAPIGGKVADFTRADAATGQAWAFHANTREAKATVLVFLGAGCPVSNAYGPRLQELHARFAKLGVVFLGIYSNPTDTAAEAAAHAKKFAIPFPVVKDDGTTLADKLAVERVPTAYVLDAARTVRYKGRIDDQFAPGVQRPKPTTRELANAIDAVVEGRDVTVPFAAAAGCLLTREKDAKPAAGEPVTYTKHIAGILQSKCQDCHRPGEAAPFALMSYKYASGWADMIREVVANDIMPPWHADAPRGHFKNDRRLSAEEKKTLLAWIEQGCPEGKASDLPPVRTFAEGWRLGRQPDEIRKMNKTVKVPAQPFLGIGMAYQYVEVGEAFAEDKWVQAVEVRPEFRAAVHHIIAFVIPPGGSIFDIAGSKFGTHMLAAYVPGDEPIIMPAGYAKLVEKGSKIVFEVHYTPMGRAGADCSMIGIVYAKEPPVHPILTDAVFNGRFAIPAGEERHEVQSVKTFKNDSVLLAMAPHMHLRGKAFQFDLHHRDGKTERLLTVPKYDFNWQVSYDLAEPKTIPAGAKIVCTAAYDNSTKNPFNPDPTRKVRWGNQTTDEMMIGFVTFHEK